jgi:hypothetical protein
MSIREVTTGPPAPAVALVIEVIDLGERTEHPVGQRPHAGEEAAVPRLLAEVLERPLELPGVRRFDRPNPHRTSGADLHQLGC